MKTTQKILAALVAAPLLLGSVTAVAEDAVKKEKSTSVLIPYGMKFLFAGVELTDEQKGKVLALSNKNRKEAKKVTKDDLKAAEEATKAELNKLELEMQEVVLMETFDEKEVQAIARKMADASIAENVAKLREQHQFVSLMSAEQKALIKANIAENQEKKANKLTF